MFGVDLSLARVLPEIIEGAVLLSATGGRSHGELACPQRFLSEAWWNACCERVLWSLFDADAMTTVCFTSSLVLNSNLWT